ncbi:gastrin-releasing peptide receptor-like [Branchiostoma floridae x Branchiostoma japonicum]
MVSSSLLNSSQDSKDRIDSTGLVDQVVLAAWYSSDDYRNRTNLTQKAFQWASMGTSSDDDVGEPPKWALVIVAVIFSTIALTGILGNGTVIRIVWSNKTMRNVPNIFIASLAMADLLVLVSCVPITVANYFLGEYVFGDIMCKLTPFVQFTSIGVSIFTLTAMSYDRYRAIVKPMSLQANHALRRTNILAVSIWIGSMCLAIPDVVFSKVVELNITTFNDTNPNDTSVIFLRSCAPFPMEYKPLYPQAKALVQFTVMYCIPLITIGVFYVLIARHLILSARNMPCKNMSTVRQLEARKNVAKTVLILVAIFALCWLPVHIVNLWLWFSWGNSPLPPPPLVQFAGMVVSQGLMYSNSCVNPFALFLLSKSFRDLFKRYLLCCCITEAERKKQLEENAMRTLRYTALRRTVTTTNNTGMTRADTCLSTMTVL